MQTSKTGASIETVTLNNVEIQANGIIRNSKGRLIARLVDSIDFEGEHVKGNEQDASCTHCKDGCVRCDARFIKTTKPNKSIEERVEEFKKERTEAISEMFDNVDESGIYPTTIFFERLDKQFTQALQEHEQQVREEIVEKIERLQTPEPRQSPQEADGYNMALDNVLQSIKPK